MDQSGIHVAEYLTQLPPKKILQDKLHQAISRAKETVAKRRYTK